jgi:hypothetical protein
MQQITRRAGKRKPSPPAVVVHSRVPWRKIEEHLARFFKSVGAQIEARNGDVYLYVAAENSPATGLDETETAPVAAQDVPLISLSELAQALAQELAEIAP